MNTRGLRAGSATAFRICARSMPDQEADRALSFTEPPRHVEADRDDDDPEQDHDE